MKDHVYKLIELTGTSTKSMEDAVNCALKRASRSIKNLRWFEVVETRGDISDGQVAHWQVTVKVGFTVDDFETISFAGENVTSQSSTRGESTAPAV